MDIQAEKLKLIHWIASQEDPGVIKQLLDLKESEEADWWDQISAEEKAEIEEGLAQADRNELTPHEEVMAKYKQWLSK